MGNGAQKYSVQACDLHGDLRALVFLHPKSFRLGPSFPRSRSSKSLLPFQTQESSPSSQTHTGLHPSPPLSELGILPQPSFLRLRVPRPGFQDPLSSLRHKGPGPTLLPQTQGSRPHLLPPDTGVGLLSSQLSPFRKPGFLPSLLGTIAPSQIQSSALPAHSRSYLHEHTVQVSRLQLQQVPQQRQWLGPRG